MSKILEKQLKDAGKEDKLTFGTRQVLNSVKNSKLIVLSQSMKKEMVEMFCLGNDYNFLKVRVDFACHAHKICKCSLSIIS